MRGVTLLILRIDYLVRKILAIKIIIILFYFLLFSYLAILLAT